MTMGAYLEKGTVREVLLEHAVRHPERLYVRCVFPDGDDARLTYGGLVARGSQISQELRALGADRGDVVLIILPHGVDLYASFFGAILGGQVPAILAVPSFKLNPEHYQAELKALIQRSQARAVVTDRATREYLDGQLGLDGVPVLVPETLPAAECPVPDVAVRPEDPVLLQHSSGSTGLKKGVALSNRAILQQVAAYAPALELRETDRIASWLPLYHDMGLIACTVLPAITGVPVSAISPFHWVARPGSLLRLIDEDRCTLTWMPNFAYEFLAKRVRASQIEWVRLDSMRGWINCSEPTIAESHRRFLARYAPMGVQPETLWTCYAAAETTFAISQSSDRVPPRVERVQREAFLTHREALPVTDPSEPALETLSGGRLISGTDVRIMSDSGEELPERCVGEIAIRCASLFSGYFRDPESSARALRDGWYFSGDLGYVADGHLFITGRKKDLIIIAGKNYYPQDIERILSETPGIYPGRVVALGMDDAEVGTQRLIVLAERDETEPISEEELAAEVRRAVAERMDCVIDDLQLLPHMWLLKTSSGKIARAPNLQRYLETRQAAAANA